MNKNSTLVGKLSIALTVTLALVSTNSSAQVPNLIFKSPVLTSGTAGAVGATYKFSNVYTGVNAFISIKKKSAGAVLTNIDDSTIGYYNAWQPVVDGPSTNNTDTYITWDINFKTTSGSNYTFGSMDFTAYDIDGDDVKLKEYLEVKGNSTFTRPSNSVLELSNLPAGGNHDHEFNNDNLPVLQVVSPASSRAGIDSTFTDVSINYLFLNKNNISITTGSEIKNTGNNGTVTTMRDFSFYFNTTSPVSPTLPITYKSFSAIAKNKTADLYWITEFELSNDHFEVERSFDQVNFRTIAMVLDAESASINGRQYSYTDNSTDLNGHNVVYYRLKQVDTDGKFTYSVVKIVRFATATKAFVQVSPNPYMDKLNINFISESNTKAEVRLVGINGQVTATKSADVTKGYNNIQLLNLNSIAPGIYIVDITVDGKVIDRQKVVKN